MKRCQKCGGATFFPSGGCKPCSAERVRQWIAKNRDWRREYTRNYMKKLRHALPKAERDALRRAVNEYHKNNRASINRRMIEWTKRWRDELADGYIRRLLLTKMGISNPSQEMISAKREQVAIHRAIRDARKVIAGEE